MKTKIQIALLPALFLATLDPFAAGLPTPAPQDAVRSRPSVERAADLLAVEGPANAPGVAILGELDAGGALTDARRFAFVADDAGRAEVRLPAASRRPGTHLRVVWFRADGTVRGQRPLTELPLELVLPAAGDLRIVAASETFVELENASRGTIGGAGLRLVAGAAWVELPASLQIPAGARVRGALGAFDPRTDLRLEALPGAGALALSLADGSGSVLDTWRPAALAATGAALGTTTSAEHLPGAGSATGTLAQEDLPDANFTDSNGDGIDGDVNRAIFVDALSGSPTGSGTRNDPLLDLQAAIDLAAATPGRDHVYVSRGTYAGVGGGAIALAEGVSVWGGYDAARKWRRSASYTTTFTSTVPEPDGLVGVRATGLVHAVTLGDVTVTTADAAGGALHNYGIKAYQTQALRLERVDVVAGAGGHGLTGQVLPGGGSAGGGNGGNGGSAPLLNGKAGSQGATGTNAGPAGGGGGSAGTAGGAGGTGHDGQFGSTGANGTPAGNQPSLLGSVLIVDGQGGAGKVGGTGSGAGGGGGGGASLFTSGGKGGKGGSGGAGGAYGAGGSAGGSSIALFVSASNVALVDGNLQAGDGGVGGMGGSRGSGTTGAPGQNGQTVGAAGNGGRGGRGGTGGPGGFGAGGGGGHTFAIVLGLAGTVQLDGTTLATGTPGAGGSSSGIAGFAGQAQTIEQL